MTVLSAVSESSLKRDHDLKRLPGEMQYGLKGLKGAVSLWVLIFAHSFNN